MTGNWIADLVLIIIGSMIFASVFEVLMRRSNRKSNEEWNRKKTCRQCGNQGEIIAEEDNFDGCPSPCSFPCIYWARCTDCGIEWSFPM